MTVTDPIADLLTRIRNSLAVEHDTVQVPASKMKYSIAQIFKEEGFLRDVELLKGKSQQVLRLHLRYDEKQQPAIKGLKRVSRPGLRVYVGQREIPKVYGGIGIAIVSTSKGIMTGQKAWREKVGGELLCYIW